MDSGGPTWALWIQSTQWLVDSGKIAMAAAGYATCIGNGSNLGGTWDRLTIWGTPERGGAGLFASLGLSGLL